MKDTLINLYKEAKLDHPVAKMAIEFLETYDGSNEEDLNRFFTFLLMTLQDYEIADIKAKGYDAMDEAKGDADSQISKIKDDMKHLESGSLPPMPMETTGEDEGEVSE